MGKVYNVIRIIWLRRLTNYLKDILAAIDMNAKNVWEDLSDDERKQVSSIC